MPDARMGSVASYRRFRLPTTAPCPRTLLVGGRSSGYWTFVALEAQPQESVPGTNGEHREACEDRQQGQGDDKNGASCGSEDLKGAGNAAILVGLRNADTLAIDRAFYRTIRESGHVVQHLYCCLHRQTLQDSRERLRRRSAPTSLRFGGDPPQSGGRGVAIHSTELADRARSLLA